MPKDEGDFLQQFHRLASVTSQESLKALVGEGAWDNLVSEADDEVRCRAA